MLNDELERMWNQQADEHNQWSELGLCEKLEFAVEVEREACANVCDADADKIEQEAQRAIENGEHDEVSSLRSTAWKLSVAAELIRARSNDKGQRTRTSAASEVSAAPACCAAGDSTE